MGFRSLVSGGSEQAKFSIGVGISFPAMLATYVFARSNLQYSLSKIAMFLAFILAVASTSKIFILIAVIVIVYEGGGRLKGALVLLALMLVLFGFSHILLAKFSSDPEIGMFSALINTLFVYSYGGIAAYSELLKGSVVLDPLASFVSLKSFFDIFFVNSIASDPILPWVDIGRWNTNNYTALGYWYAFLGGFYVFFVPLFLGTFYGFFFNVESLNKPAFHLYRILLVFCLIFTMWGDLFFPALKVHIAFMFFSLLSSLTKKTRLPNVY